MDELILARRQKEKKLADYYESKGIKYDDRKINQTRLNAVNHVLGVSPVWNEGKRAIIRDNDLSSEEEKKHLNDIRISKIELKTTINSSGLSRMNTRGEFMGVEEDEPAPVIPMRGTVQDIAMLHKKLNEQRQNKIIEDNKKINRLTAHQLFVHAPETPESIEVFKELRDSDVDSRIDVNEYLREGHERMYKSKLYNDIVKRRKDISLCKGATGSLTDTQKKLSEQLIVHDHGTSAYDTTS